MKNKKLKLYIFLILSFYSNAYGWGVDGHRIIGEIAQRSLNVKAKTRLNKILINENISDISTWADEIRSSKKLKYQKFLPWHYATIPIGTHYDDLPVKPEGDIYIAIKNIIHILQTTHFDKMLASEKMRKYIKLQVKLLVHFVADIHQPLHVGNAQDKGGNLCLVKYFGKYTSLHSVWDTLIIGTMNYSYTEFSDHLFRINKKSILKMETLNVKTWLTESSKLRPSIYPLSVDRKVRSYCVKNFDEYNSLKINKSFQALVPILSYDYNFKHKKMLKRRLYLGGKRLGQLLNNLFSK